ncbi:hypothetical protein OS493_037826, partial [Desmophyllum pertusum]
RQVKKFNKAKANNEGIKLTISQAQIRIFRKEGKGAPRMGGIPLPINNGKGTPRIGIPPPFIGNWPKKQLDMVKKRFFKILALIGL